jgi:YidC/Oxa1 family membrane protein insertase
VETRAILAFVLSVTILVGYQVFFAPEPVPVPATDPAVRGEAQVPAAPAVDSEAAGLPPAAYEQADLPAAVAPAAPAVEPRETLDVATDLLNVEFVSLGGRIRSVRLHDYRDTAAPDSPLFDIVDANGVLPLGLYWTRPDGTVGSDTEVEYRMTKREADAEGAVSVEMEGRATTGETLRKTLRIAVDSYVLDYRAEVDADYAPGVGVAWARRIGEPAGGMTGSFGGVDGPAVYVNDALEGASAADLEEPQIHSGMVDWAGYAEHYFMAAYYPETRSDLRFVAAAGNGVGEGTLWAETTDGTVEYNLFLGPKKLWLLGSLGHSLDGAIDLGWFAFVARPMLEGLLYIDKVTGNYGWSIILLTILVRIIFYPVNAKQAKAMKGMQKVQPELKKIQEKYKDDREQLNKEMMELYRRHKVNPLAGCLPMLVQLPVFLGLYNALMQAIELRHAPFVGWITDLSQPDRLGTLGIPFVSPPGIPILTLLMGASMLVQQKMTPAAGDPAQQRMMMFLPVIFTVMFVNFPSGLVLYWFANNVMSIGQQYMTNRSTA